MTATATLSPLLDIGLDADAPDPFADPPAPETSEVPAPAPAFMIDSEDRANWYLRKVANLEAEKARVTAQAAAIVAALDRERQDLEARHGADLEAWARSEVERRGKGRTLRLLQGTIAFRRVPGGLRVADAEAALVEARTAYPDLIVTTVKLDAAGYRERAKEALESTGELLPGVESYPERDSMSLRFGGKEPESA